MHKLPFRPFASALVLAGAVVSAPAQDLCSGISPAPSSALTTARIASGLSRPIFATAPPADTARVFVVEQDGRIKIVKNHVLQAGNFLDINTLVRSPADGGGGEQGLLGLAFHPQYATNGWFFVYYTDNSGTINVARYTRSAANPDLADAASRAPVLTIAHPTHTNHNGGMMAFAPDDGYLYIGTGDGGDRCDPGAGNGNAQSLTSNLGKILRINVNALPYTSPAGNPYVGVAGNDEIWARGVRNPWRWSFDRANSDLYVGDVGQDVWEELNWRPGNSAGNENYGWVVYEGNHCPNPSCGTPPDCTVVPPAQHTPPVYEYTHSGSPGGCSITGGYVYRGCRMPSLAGTYFFADYCNAWIQSLKIVGGSVTQLTTRTTELAPGGGLSIGSINSFGEDGRGEVYIVDGGGELYKILPVLRNMEASGAGAAPFLLGPTAWTWEDLKATSGHQVVEYQVYRSSSRGNGIFDCIFKTTGTSWTGGDPVAPAAGNVYAYLVTARNAVERTSPGTGSAGQPRQLSSVTCP